MPDHKSLKPGALLAGKYRLEAEIGRGAMGTVWSAMRESLNQRVAIKVISAEHAGSVELRKRFDTEAKAAAQLQSRFVVGVFDHGETDAGLPFIVMEHLEGESLEDRIARQGCISLSDTVRITRHVTRALSRAHARGIIHRDLKPANIFICKSEDEDDNADWTAKVLDFGIAKIENYGERSTTKTGAVLGTPLFMSPEQVRGASSVDQRADLYSLGMMVYNMLTGTFAFEGQSFGDLLVSICTDPLPDLLALSPGLPSGVGDWFQKACAREPDDRFQTADEMMAALLDACEGELHSVSRMSVIDSPTTTLKPVPRPLAETFAADDTTPQGTPDSQTKSSHHDREAMDSAGASAVTLHDRTTSRSRGFLLAAAAGAALCISTLLILSSRTPRPTDAEQSELASAGPVSEPRPLPTVVAEQPENRDPELKDPAPVDPEPAAPKVAAPKPAQPQTKPVTKPQANPPTVSGPRPNISPNPAPQPAPKPAPLPQPAPKPVTKPAVDLGF